VRLMVAAIFALCSIRSGRHEPVQRGLVNGEVDDGPASTIPANDIAMLQDLPQKLFRVAHRPTFIHCARAQPWAKDGH
jgi:hypothetical protein